MPAKPKSSPSAAGRDREATTQRLIDAAIAILREEGFDRLGVNAVAKRAGVSKVLIYRYFDSYEGLLRAVAEQIDPLDSTMAERFFGPDSPQPSPAKIVQMVLERLHQQVSSNGLVRQLMLWELTNRNEVTDTLAASREEVGVSQTAALADYFAAHGIEADLDLQALVALATAGVFYMTLRSASVQMFNGVDITSDAGWKRITNALTPLIDALEKP